VLHGIVALLAIALPSQRCLFSGLGSLPTTFWTLALFALDGQVGEDGFHPGSKT
jgi:hypothetical protein